MRQVWLGLPYLLQVWYILTKLAASMVNRAQLAASLAALFRQRHYDDPTIDRIATHLQNLYIIQTQF